MPQGSSSPTSGLLAGSSGLVVATINVNGIRAAMRRGMGPWLAEAAPDVLLLQEVRAPDEVLRDLLPGWTIAHEPGPTAGRAGVGVASRRPMAGIRIGLPGEPESSAGRWIEADIEHDGALLTAISTYVHTATAQTPSMDVKLAFMDRASARLQELARRAAVLGGDLNIAHDERDLRNWKGNRGKSGFLPQEQAYLSRWRDRGWVDAGRTWAGDVDGPYTWWSWRGKAFDNDAGWRIDYLWCSPPLAAAVSDVSVDRAASYAERFSDHAPVRMCLREPH